MIDYNDILESVQAELGPVGDRPSAVCVWHSYSGSKLLGTSNTEAQAWRVPCTKRVELVITNQDDINKWANHEAWVTRVTNDRWLIELRDEFSHLNDVAFQEIYSYAFNEVHSDGYDAIVEKMLDIDGLFRKISNSSVKPTWDFIRVPCYNKTIARQKSCSL